MYRIKQTVANVDTTFTNELVVREAKYNELEACVTNESLSKTTFGNRLYLNDAGDYHNMYSSI